MKLLMRFGIFLLLLGLLGGGFADYALADNTGSDGGPELEVQIEQWDEQGFDPNHSEVVEKIRTYIEQNVTGGTFASLHIDREERPLGTIVLSFTEMVNEEQQRDLQSIAKDPAKVKFREVAYTEEELMQKQSDVDMAALTDQGVEIVHTGIDVIENQVEVGIKPYHEETIALVHEMFGQEMIKVVEGHEAVTFDTAETAAANESIQPPNQDESNFLQRMMQVVGDWFKNLF